MKTMYSCKEHRHAQPLCKILLQYFNFFCSLWMAFRLEVRKILVWHRLFCSLWEIWKLGVRSICHLGCTVTNRQIAAYTSGTAASLKIRHLYHGVGIRVPELESSVGVCVVWLCYWVIFVKLSIFQVWSVPLTPSLCLLWGNNVVVAVMASTRLLRCGESESKRGMCFCYVFLVSESQGPGGCR